MTSSALADIVLVSHILYVGIGVLAVPLIIIGKIHALALGSKYVAARHSYRHDCDRSLSRRHWALNARSQSGNGHYGHQPTKQVITAQTLLRTYLIGFFLAFATLGIWHDVCFIWSTHHQPVLYRTIERSKKN